MSIARFHRGRCSVTPDSVLVNANLLSTILFGRKIAA